MQQDKKKDLNSLILQYGLLGGVTAIMYMLVIYIIDVNLLLNIWVNFLGILAIEVTFMVLAIRAFIAKRGYNYIDFRESLKTAFGTAALMLLMLTLFNVVLYKYIDPDLVGNVKKIAMKRTEEYYKKSDLSPNQIQRKLDEAKAQDYSPSLLYTSLTYASSIFIAFLVSLAISAVFYLLYRDNKPVEIPILEDTEPNP
jgi:hypothetical protein